MQSTNSSFTHVNDAFQLNLWAVKCTIFKSNFWQIFVNTLAKQKMQNTFISPFFLSTLPPSQGNHCFYSFTIVSSIYSRASYKWNRAGIDLWGKISFTQHKDLGIHPCDCVSLKYFGVFSIAQSISPQQLMLWAYHSLCINFLLKDHGVAPVCGYYE